MDEIFTSYANTTDKFLIQTVDFIKKRWIKADKIKMQELLKQKQETEKKEKDAFNKWSKLETRQRNIRKKIDNLNKKYTYTKKYKVENPNYNMGV
jgi:predicted  nucleic acid-binding Zn ribbon protein